MNFPIKPPKKTSMTEQRTIRRLKSWANQWDVVLDRIPEDPRKRTPDFRLIFPKPLSTELIVEVKELHTSFEVDPEEFVATIPKRVGSGNRYQPANTIRNKIQSARSQLKRFASNGYPTLLLIGYWNPILDPLLQTDIPIAMYGGGPRIKLEGTPYELISTARGGRQIADNTNRSISGIGRLEFNENRRSSQIMVLYDHNNPRIQIPMGLPGVVRCAFNK